MKSLAGSASAQLTTTDHRRDAAGLTYVYPVMSRRSGGLSIGINLNPNNACNWRCLYCQVPNLVRGAAPAIDLQLLRKELRELLQDTLRGEFFQRFQVAEAQRVIRDIAISGNGEPTSAAEFDQVVLIIGEICQEFALPAAVKRVLISNGSLIGREQVRRGLAMWKELGGEIWFKLDSATEAGIQRINGVHIKPAQVLQHLQLAASLCPVWIQTCVFGFDGQPPSDDERAAYLAFLSEALSREAMLQGVLLYGLARPSLQPEAPRLAALPEDWLEAFAEQIRALGLVVRLSP